MKLSWDEAKRRATLDSRKLDFAQAADVFKGLHLTREDLRRDYGEHRFITVGYLGTRLMVLVSTPRGAAQHVISMRKANDREQKAFAKALEA